MVAEALVLLMTLTLATLWPVSPVSHDSDTHRTLNLKQTNGHKAAVLGRLQLHVVELHSLTTICC